MQGLQPLSSFIKIFYPNIYFDPVVHIVYSVRRIPLSTAVGVALMIRRILSKGNSNTCVECEQNFSIHASNANQCVLISGQEVPL